MSDQVRDVWVYLAASPLTGLTLTLIAYRIGLWINARAGGAPLANPVLLAVLMLAALLLATDTDYDSYFEGAQFVHFLLGPATVALAVPLYRNFAQVRRSAVALLTALIAGSLTAAASAIAIGWALGATETTLRSLAPKSVTTPIAMGIAEKLGGLPSLTAVLVILTGILGGAVGTSLLRLIRIRDERTIGFALGVGAHGIGTARALQVSETVGAFAGLAVGINGLATALLLPLLYALLF